MIQSLKNIYQTSSNLQKTAVVVFMIAFIFSLFAWNVMNKKNQLHESMSLAELPESVYDSQIPYVMKEAAEQYKDLYVNNKLEDVIINDEEKLPWQTKWLELEFEQHINSIYLGDIKEAETLSAQIALINYATDMFDNRIFINILKRQSKPLADFVINYQIEKSLDKKCSFN